jgi:hypothetical protein
MAQTSSTLPLAVGPTHPVYATWRPVWALLAHVYEGSGGFLDGTLLVAHPREWKDHDRDTPSIPTKKLLERRALARYENVAALIIEQKLSSLFREPPTRRVASGIDHPWLQWTANVDGAGRSLDTWLRDQMRLAMVFGHMVCLMDRRSDSGPTAADAAPLLLRAYSPLDVIDWLQDDAGTLTAIKAVEPLMRDTLAEPFLGDTLRYRVLEVTAEEAVRSEQGPTPHDALVPGASVAHRFGTLPVALLYAQRRAFTPLIGQSVLYDPFLYVDLFNLTSEIRELLRKQTFSVLNIPLGVRADGGTQLSVEEAQTLAGAMTGTGNVLFSGLPAAHLSPDTANVTVYQEERRELLRTIYRLCAVPYDNESRAAESAEARKIKREEFTAMVGKYADELHAAELHLAQLWFRGTYGADRWQREWDAAQPSISYPQTFGEPTWAEVGEEMTAAELTLLRESPTFARVYAEKQLPRFLPDATPETVSTIRKELEAIESPAEVRAAARAQMGAAFGRDEDPEDDEAQDDEPEPPPAEDARAEVA